MEDARGRSEEQDVRLGKAVALEQWRAVQQAGAERDLCVASAPSSCGCLGLAASCAFLPSAISTRTE